MITLTPAELKEIHAYLHEYIHTEEAQSMRTFCQHGTVSTYDHVMNVVRLSYFINKSSGWARTRSRWSPAPSFMTFTSMTGTRKETAPTVSTALPIQSGRSTTPAACST